MGSALSQSTFASGTAAQIPKHAAWSEQRSAGAALWPPPSKSEGQDHNVLCADGGQWLAPSAQKPHGQPRKAAQAAEAGKQVALEASPPRPHAVTCGEEAQTPGTSVAPSAT
eukprot:364197-Chlamydomonas_euryale.AAC.30